MFKLKKKFKVRVSLFAEDKYTVSYAEYYIIPMFWNWDYLYYWFDQGHPGVTEALEVNLFSVHDAEKIASEINSIEDAKVYNNKALEDRNKWKQEEIEFHKKNIPYSSKTFLKP